MARNANRNNEEPNTAPEPNRWYNINLGPSFKDHPNHPSTKVFTLRYEFKPASIDKSQPGLLHKGKNNKVTVEYQNNQYGKPKVTFEGVSEDYKENDAVLFFDGETLRLDRLHRAVKRLRHVRLPGESAAASVPAPAVETYSPPVNKATNQQSLNKSVSHQMQVHVDPVGTINLDSLVPGAGPPNPSAMSSGLKDYEPEENLDVVNDNDDNFQTASTEKTSGKASHTGLDIDINLPHQGDTDDEIADVDISDGEVDKGPNAAEALRAQVNAEGRNEQASSSSTSTGSDSSASENGTGSGSNSGSGSGSSSSDSESSDNDSEISI